MTASEVVFAINAVTATTGVRASALKVAEGDYRIVFTAEETNKAIQITGDNGGPTLAALSASADNGATYTTELAAHQPAQLRPANHEIGRAPCRERVCQVVAVQVQAL